MQKVVVQEVKHCRSAWFQEKAREVEIYSCEKGKRGLEGTESNIKGKSCMVTTHKTNCN